MTENSKLLVDSAAGVYVPQVFAEKYWDNVTNADELIDEHQSLLGGEQYGEDSESYWESWNTVLDKAKLNFDGVEHKLYHDEDLWSVPVDEYEKIGVEETDEEETFTIEATYSFKGKFFIKAKNRAVAERMVKEDCGMLIGEIQSSLNDEDVDWDFPVHPDVDIVLEDEDID